MKTKAEKMADHRSAKEKRGECRQCPNPVAVNPKTGKPRKSCASCLAIDAKRNKRNRDM